MARFLVTGGCGFIGSHLADALVQAGHHVTILDNLSSGKRDNAPGEASFIEGDILDAALVEKLCAQSDAVVHLAAIASVQRCHDEWLASHKTNLTGSITVLDAAARAAHKPRVVYASSAAVYGDNPNLPLAETEAPAPQTSYGLDKLSCEHYAAHAFRAYGLSSVGLRFFNVYGPRQDPASPYSGVISKFVHAATARQPITYFGDGEQTRDFIYVADIVRLILAALQCAPGAHVLNGCTGSALSLKQLAQLLRTLTNAALPETHAPARPGDIRHSLGNPAHAAALCGFQAATTPPEGLAQLLAALPAM